MGISPKWNTDAPNAALALVFLKTSAKCSFVPAQPEAITGMFTASQTLPVISMSNPALVPS